MFGLLKLEPSAVGDKDIDFQMYQAHYCGLCKILANDYGQLSRLITNYEATFMYLLLTASREEKNLFIKSRCPVSLSKKEVCLTSDAKTIADISMILFYEKMLDDESDEKRSLPGFVKRNIQNKYRKAVARLSKDGFNAGYIHQLMIKQRKLEARQINSLEVISEQTALMMAYIFKFISSFNSKTYQEFYIKLGYQLGKWIYIMDSLIDFEKDFLLKQFNPILLKCNFISQKPRINQLPDLLQVEIKNNLIEILRNIRNILPRIKLHRNHNLIKGILVHTLERKSDIVFEAMASNSKNSRRNLRILQASVAGVLLPEAAFASNGLDQICGSLVGPILMCGVLVYAFKIMFRCKTVPCCPCCSHQESVAVEDGCGRKKVYKRGWDGKYRDQSSCC